MKKYLAEIVFIVITLFLLIFLKLYFDFNPPAIKETQEEEKVIEEPTLKYGLPVDSFILENGFVKRNQNLSDILLQKGISYVDIDRIVKLSEPVFDVRKIRYKNPYYFFLNKDSVQSLAYFVYEMDAVNYLVYQFSDSLCVSEGEKETKTVFKTASGTIKSSLWNAMVDNDVNPILAIELSEIYAWSIDFFGIQKGDRFRVIYEEKYVDSTSVGLGKIYAADFQHVNYNHYAFLFLQDDVESYYDEKGKSLKKAFLKAPLKYSRISSRFSNGRYHPILKIVRPHHGVDYAAPTGTPVHSIGDGVVTRKGYQARGGGNYIYIKHNSVYKTCYMHLRSFAKGMAPGVRVRQGQVIGYVGSTGLATGPHLDFRVFKNGSAINPLKVKAPPVEPVKPELINEFTELKDSLINELSKIN